MVLQIFVAALFVILGLAVLVIGFALAMTHNDYKTYMRNGEKHPWPEDCPEVKD